MPDRPDIEAGHGLAETVRSTVSEHDMFPRGSAVVVMLSGGGDSVALLRLLADGELGGSLTAVALHVDHMLRGEASDEDRRFCEELCASLGIEMYVEKVDIRALAEAEGLNIEDAGRRVRYERADRVLDEVCAREGLSAATGRIAVAHTRDDRIETTLMRLAQGAGAAGLTSPRPVRDRVVRPLFDCRRADVRAYLEAAEQPWREDETNTDTDRLRAKVRHELLPVFRGINPRFDESLSRTLAVLTDEDDLLAEMAEAFVDDWLEVGEGEISFDRAMLGTLSRPMLRRTIRAALARTFPQLSRLEFDHVEILVDGVDEDGFAHDLPGGVRAYDEYGRMVVTGSGGEPPLLASRELPVPGELDLGRAGLIRAIESTGAEGTGTRSSVVVDAGKIEGELEVGPPVAGERMRPLGMEGTKKVSDLLADEKVPRRRRPLTPVVRDRSGVVWVAGVRMSEAHKVDETTERAIGLEWTGPGAEEEYR
jgi:tRNA(Ile)-lysidine synthase